jgi:hypothetical protein
MPEAEDPHIAQQQVESDGIQGKDGKGHKEVGIIDAGNIWKDGHKDNDDP